MVLVPEGRLNDIPELGRFQAFNGCLDLGHAESAAMEAASQGPVIPPRNLIIRKVHQLHSPIDIGIGDLNGAELYLREVGGVSRSEAKALVSRFFSIARREVGQAKESEELKAIAALLDQRKAALAA